MAVSRLGRGFFARPVEQVARELIGCTLEHNGASGLIVETESYHQDEPACHAFVGRTERNAVLFGPPGRAYVYLSYGIHSVLNFVTNERGVGAAVLIRAIEPLDGIDLMRRRRRSAVPSQLCSGPGKLSEALAVGLDLNGADLARGPLRVFDREREPAIVASPRIGISKATELPWRFCLEGSEFVSRPRPVSAVA